MFLIDANVLIDVTGRDSDWSAWSGYALARAADQGRVHINPVIYAEVSVIYPTVEAAEEALNPFELERLELPYPAAFLAGKAFLAYRRAGGLRRSAIADFFIGAHAAVSRLALLTRDPRPYRTYFPTVRVISPDSEEWP